MLKDELETLLETQKKEWSLLATNYDALSKVERKFFDFGGFIVRVEHNPARAVSSLAKTDAATIAQRKCFLCEANRPKEQEGIEFLGKYHALTNPFPIFPKHFTIADKNHSLQSISASRLLDMLKLSAEMEGYVTFYNGPRAGASAPDHFHFQAGNASYLPQPEYLPCDLIGKESFSSGTQREITGWAEDTIAGLKNHKKETEAAPEEEPMMNIFCRYENGKWTMTITGRKKHRPSCFFEDGGLKISPGAVDMAGVIIADRKEDFERITADDIRKIYAEVSLGKL